ncbi:MAG: Holliday junction resolvase RuvX [Gammaproteobacteria bacterium]|jgi:putative Holliday junction resolvase
MSSLLGFDFGSHKIGIAVGQTVTATASPLTTLSYIKQKPDWNGIEKLISEWKPDTIIVGLPYQMDDKEAELAVRARKFARQLEGRFKIPVEMIDERLTSKEASNRLGKKAAKDATLVDSMAAKLILETWLNR